MERRRPSPPFKHENAIKVRIAIHQLAQRCINPPIDFTPRKMQPEQAQDGQRLDDIAERTRFENEDFQNAGETSHTAQPAVPAVSGFRAVLEAGRFTAVRVGGQRRSYLPNAKRSASRGGKPAAMIFAWAAGMS